MPEDAILAALRWQDAIDTDRVDWSAFTAWLESDPAHNQAYDEIAQIDRLLRQRRRAIGAGTAVARKIVGHRDHRPCPSDAGSSRY